MGYKQIEERLIPTTQYAAPTTGQTVTVGSSGSTTLTINPAGTLATLTITMPSSPTDGDRVQFGTTQIVTGLTMNGGTIVGGLSTLAVGSGGTWVYNATSASWIKM